MMTERKAAQICNKVYAAAYAKQITAYEALQRLNELEEYMSDAQFSKYNDFINDVQNNTFKFDCGPLTWVCDFYNTRSVYHFSTREAAEAYGRNSGFQFTVYFEE